MKTVLKRGALLSLIAVIAILSGFNPSKADSEFKAKHISWLFQMVYIGGIVPNTNSFDIFYSKDYLIVRTQSTVITSRATFRPDTNEVLDQKLRTDSNYVYYISKRGEEFGLYFDSSSIRTGKQMKVNVDSMLKVTLSPPAFFYGQKDKHSLNVVKDEKEGILIEKYQFKRREVQEPDSIYFYYRKEPMEISFTIKDKRDDNMYLYKTRAICNPTPKGTFSNVNFAVKKYEHSFEITDTDVPEEEIANIIQLFNHTVDLIK